MFDARQYVADLALEPYLFTDMTGTVRQLPNLKTLTADQATRIYEGEVMEILPQVLGEGSWDAVKAMPVAALTGLVTDWVKHSEVAPGESEASSPSSESTARPSKPTSRSAAASKTRRR